MLFRGQRYQLLSLFLVTIFLCVIVLNIYHTQKADSFPATIQSWAKDAVSPWGKHEDQAVNSTQGLLSPDMVDISATHSILLSASTPDQKYFRIIFGSYEAMNPNIIPHPQQPNLWIIVAQQKHDSPEDFVYTEISCNATFLDGTLRCIEQPVVLPIPVTFGPHCKGDLAHIGLNRGPHDGRVFFGPKAPYTVYGSNSAHTCFGQWLQDFRTLVDWEDQLGDWDFRAPTDLQRPPPYQPIEKNWFPFWDNRGQIYMHYDIYPQRVFAKLNLDGAVGPDLASLARQSDQLCMARYMPKVGEILESMHQATNSLLITLCKRIDASCHQDMTNTYVMTIFQHKTFHSYHSVYEPYLMLFSQEAPFEIRAISKKPFWINGRGKPGEKKPKYLPLKPTDPWNQTEMMYITSMSWKTQGQTYHGYSDDKLFLGFGIEDEQTAGIDIFAGDLMQDLGFCEVA